MKVFVVIMVARQLDGEYILIRSEKAYKSLTSAEKHLKTLTDQYVKDGKPLTIKVTTPFGEVDCQCEIGLFELDVEE